MKTYIYNIKQLFEESAQWIVPVYQRHYVWESKRDEQIPGMWEDWKAQAEKLLNGETPRPHYFGAIIYSDNKPVPREILKRDLVDGQQRLTTFQLAFAALRDTGKNLNCTTSMDINDYIFNVPNETTNTNQDDDKYKLFPSRHDRSLFQKIIATKKQDDKLKDASELTKAYNCFCDSIENFVKEKTKEMSEEESQDLTITLIETLKKALLESFQIVLIQLGEDDDPQQIFASLNGKGQPLSPFDLIRNDIFYRARADKTAPQSLFENDWLYFEDSFWSTPRGQGHTRKARADHFIIDVVVAQVAKEINKRRIAAEYQNYVQEYKNKGYFNSVTEELQVLKNYGKSYRNLVELPEKSDTNRIAKLLNLWDLSTMNPLVLWIDTRKNLSLEDKKTLFLMMESYIIRRYICKLRTNAFDKTIPVILGRMRDQENDIIGAFKGFLEIETAEYIKMPNDGEVLSACEQMPIYGDSKNNSTKSARKLKYILGCTEEHVRTKFNETVRLDTDDLSIEHIMPQQWAKNWTLKDGTIVTHENYWEAFEENPHLDSSVRGFMEKRQGLIHTIGNLTLVTNPFNSSLSNSAWKTKRKQIEEESLLKLNRDIAKKEEWDDETIKTRSEELAKRINEIWPSS